MIYRILFFVIAAIFTSLDSKAQVPVNAGGFEVESSYLQDGKILISNSNPKTTIKFNVTYLRNQGGGSVKTRLVTVNGTTLVGLSAQESISVANFEVNHATLTKTYEVSIDKSLLTGQPIYLGVQGSGAEGLFNNGNVKYQYIIPPLLSNAITISSVSKINRILMGEDCGFNHPNHMEKDVWKFIYQANFEITNSSVSESDVFWEWTVTDNSSYFPNQKQFLTYPEGGIKGAPQDGRYRITIEANDYLEAYDSKVIVRAKSRTTGARYSSDYIFNVSAIHH